MAQAEAVTTADHVAIRIDDQDGASGSSSCCAVCMEPSEWVVVGACGHREVCLYCGVRMRFFQDDRRCCICRAFCATVVITRADTNSRPLQQVAVDDGGSSQGQRQSAFSETSPAYGGARPAGTHWWYHGGLAAYFDDRARYEAVRNMCSTKPLPLSLPLPLPFSPTGVGNDHGAHDQDPNARLKSLLLYLAVMALFGASAGGISLASYINHWLPRVAVVIGSGLLVAACAYLDARRWWFSTSPESDAQRSGNVL